MLANIRRFTNCKRAFCIAISQNTSFRGDRQFLELILRYNEDDCRATWVLKDWLSKFLAD